MSKQNNAKAPKETPKAAAANVEVGDRKHYYMIAGEIVFIAEGEETPHSLRANGVVMSSDGKFAVPQIAMAQQTLQHVFHQRMGAEKKITVLDVVIMGIMPLGEFTPAEFNKPVLQSTDGPTNNAIRAQAGEAIKTAPDAPANDVEGIPVTGAPVEELTGHA